MALTNISPVNYSSAKGFVGAVYEINQKLETRITWLTKAYGIAQTLTEDKKRYPSVQVDDERYINMLPDTHLGNYCFWEIVETKSNNYSVHADFRCVFYFDQKDIADVDYSAMGNAKYDIRGAFRRLGVSASIRLTGIEEGFDRVYRHYDLNYVNGTELMYPYGAVAAVGKIKINAIEC